MMPKLGPQLLFPLDEILVARLYRQDLGDITSLKHSIEERGLVCPLVIAPDGLLISGARRLAAVKELGWRSVPVYVAAGVSDELHARLAIATGLLHTKSLTVREAAVLYREMQELLAEERRLVRQDLKIQTGTALGGKKGRESRGNFGKIGAMAARAITETDSTQRLDRVCHIQSVADDEQAAGPVREAARAALAEIDRTEQVNGPWLMVRRAEAACALEQITSRPDLDAAIKRKAERFSHALASEEDPAQLTSLTSAAFAMCRAAQTQEDRARDQAGQAEARRLRFVLETAIRSCKNLDVRGLAPHLRDQDVADADEAARRMNGLADAVKAELEGAAASP